MNRLASSQMEESKKFVSHSLLAEPLRPTLARYAAKDDAAERDTIPENKPDILLTNFMMLELLMTRQSSDDHQVIENAPDFDFLDSTSSTTAACGTDLTGDEAEPDESAVCLGKTELRAR